MLNQFNVTGNRSAETAVHAEHLTGYKTVLSQRPDCLCDLRRLPEAAHRSLVCKLSELSLIHI